MEVPLEHQTKESLIAYIQSLESQADQDSKRKAALEEICVLGGSENLVVQIRDQSCLVGPNDLDLGVGHVLRLL